MREFYPIISDETKELVTRRFWDRLLGPEPEAVEFREILGRDLAHQVGRRSSLSAFVGPGNLIDTTEPEKP